MVLNTSFHPSSLKAEQDAEGLYRHQPQLGIHAIEILLGLWVCWCGLEEASLDLERILLLQSSLVSNMCRLEWGGGGDSQSWGLFERFLWLELRCGFWAGCEGEAAASFSLSGLLRWLLVGLYTYAIGNIYHGSIFLI